MKYYVVFTNETIDEAISNHRDSGGYECPEDAMNDTVIHEEAGTLFTIINENREEHGKYLLTKKGAERLPAWQASPILMAESRILSMEIELGTKIAAQKAMIDALTEQNKNLNRQIDSMRGIMVTPETSDLLKDCRDALVFYDPDHTTDLVAKLDKVLGPR